MKILKFVQLKLTRNLVTALALFVVLALQALPKTALAQCNCSGKEDVAAALESSTLCFLGKVSKIEKADPLHPKEHTVNFRISKLYKSSEDTTGDIIKVGTASEESACGFPFSEGYDYIVFARGTPAHLVTDACTRTSMLEAAIADRDELEKLTSKEPPPKVEVKEPEAKKVEKSEKVKPITRLDD